MEFSNDNGVTKALTVTGNTLKTLINSSPFLNTSAAGVIQAGTILPTTAGGTGNANGTIAKTLVNSAAFLQTSGTGDIQAGTILATTAGGTGNSNGTIAKIAGGSAGKVLFQTAADTTSFTNSLNGVLQSIGGNPQFANDITTVQYYSAPTSTNVVLRNLNGSQPVIITSNSGDVILSTNVASTNHLLVRNGTISFGLAAYANSPFFTTNAAGLISKGTVLPVSAGGTGVSSFTPPNIYTYSGSGSFSPAGTPKYIKVEINGAGGGGGAGDTNKGGGGGAGGSYAQSNFVFTPGNFFWSMGAGGTAGTTGVNGGVGGTSTFNSTSPPLVMTVAGGGGGVSAGANPGNGGVGGIVSGFIGLGMYGEEGGAGSTGLGGDGGGACRGSGRISSDAHSGGGVYPGKNGNFSGVGGSGGFGNTAAGGAGAAGFVTITAYY